MCSKEALSILVPVLGTPTPPRRALRSLSPGSTWAPSSFLTLWVLESQLSLGWLRAVERSLVRAEVRIPRPVGCELPAGPGPASGSASLRGRLRGGLACLWGLPMVGGVRWPPRGDCPPGLSLPKVPLFPQPTRTSWAPQAARAWRTRPAPCGWRMTASTPP